MYVIHYIGGAINVKKMPKAQAVEYAKQINDNPTGVFPERVKLAQSAEARDIMQKRLFAQSIFHRHSDVYGMSMSELGFTDRRKGYWYLCRRVSIDSDVTLNVRIAKDGHDWQIDVLDECFCQPYDYQYLLSVNPTLDYANNVADECEKWYRRLSEWGLLSGWHEGMYV